MVSKAASIAKGDSGPSGLDTDGWRRMLTSNSFGTASSDLRRPIVDFIKNSENELLEAFTACTLIPLNKNSGLRPTGVGEVLCQIPGKV